MDFTPLRVVSSPTDSSLGFLEDGSAEDSVLDRIEFILFCSRRKIKLGPLAVSASLLKLALVSFVSFFPVVGNRPQFFLKSNFKIFTRLC